MKSIILFFLIFVSYIQVTLGQKFDRFRMTYDASIGVLPIKVAGTTNVGSNSTTTINNQIFLDSPVYRYRDTTAIAVNMLIHIGVDIPFYQNESWSIGAKLNGGVGLQQGVIAAEGLSSLVIDFPQFIYYRKMTDRHDYSFLLGYKYTMTTLPYQLLLTGFEYRLSQKKSLRFYASPYRDRYYMLYTNGDLKPMLKIGEMGVFYTHYF